MNTEKKTYRIDASGAKIGRIASQAASLLTGKNLAEYAKNKVFNTEVIIENISKLDIGEKKLVQKTYKRYSGYPGGQSEKSMEQIIDKKGRSAIVRMAVLGMLPRNKLRSKVIKNLTLKD